MRFNKKYLSLFLCLLLVMTTSTAFANHTPQASQVAKPHVGGKSGILIEAESGRILYSKSPNRKLPMASTTKIMTALVALKKGNLDEKVKVSRKAVGVEGSSIYLGYDEEISLRDLLYGLMLRSGNDAATAIAIHIGGSVEGFAKMMNETAKEIGAKNTNFTNPHGLHNDNHYSTAYDLALIAREAMKYDEFKKISKTNVWVADREKSNRFYNKNKTIRQYDGGDGVKIGYTRVAGRCLVASATRGDMQLIAVVLNDRSWFNDCYRLFDYGFANYKPMVIYSENQLMKSVYVPNGKKEILPIVTKDSLMLPLTDGELDDVKTNIVVPDELNAPIEKGTKVGTIKVFKKGQLAYTGELIARESIEVKGFWDKTLEFLQEKVNWK